MRLKDRLNQEPAFFEEVFSKAEFMTLAMLDKGFPYCIPVNFVHHDHRIYIHAATEGLKLECLSADGHVAFSMAVDIEIDREGMTTYYKSVCGRGLAYIVEDMEEKGRALDMLALRYDSKCKVPSPAANINRVAIIRIDIKEISGKSNYKKV